ncbi:nucleoside phosphatase, putative,guanosine diphosphatase, putative [Trypanosoma cruzi]|nr:nucleoside phosphatase, putative,guanosine diphosphatase, putative [Trypanosoma cruzi]
MGAAMKQSMARSRRLRRPCISLTFALLCLFLVTVVYITAYTVGKFSMDARGREKLDLTDRIIHSMTRRFQECQAQKQLLKNGHTTARMALEIAQETKKKLEMELGLMRNRNTLMLQSVEECKKELELLKENGRGAVTLALQLDRLTKERQFYMDAIAVVNRSSGVGRRQTADVFAAIAKEFDEWEDAAKNKTELLTNCNNAMRRYSIVFDAGSTGSRLHVFRYNLTSTPHAGNFSLNGTRPSLASFLRLDDELFVENYEPLSRLANPNDAVASLSPLLEAAKAYIPESLHACVPIEMKATAGLRRIGREHAEAVLDVVRRLFARGPFWMQSELDSVRILEGWEEGPLAWLTVNYLLGALNGDKNTATILDLGGGSTQIVMHPSDPKAIEAYAEFSYALKVNGRSFVVYQHSYEGNGLHAAKEQLLQAVAANNTGANSKVQEANKIATGTDATPGASADVAVDAFPCFPKGYVHTETGISNTRDGGKVPSMEECSALFRRHVVRKHQPCGSNSCGFNGVFQPDISAVPMVPVYAFSFYYDRLKPYIKDEVIRVQDVLDIASQVCRSMKSVRELLEQNDTKKNKGSLKPEMECFELSYLFTLLRYGFGFPLEQKLHIAKKINGFETAWALGASLVSLEGQYA